jgi:hypothetical protein
MEATEVRLQCWPQPGGGRHIAKVWARAPWPLRYLLWVRPHPMTTRIVQLKCTDHVPVSPLLQNTQKHGKRPPRYEAAQLFSANNLLFICLAHNFPWDKEKSKQILVLVVKLILNHQESRTLQNVDIAPQHRSSKNESIQTLIFIQPGLFLHPFSCRITR